MKKGFRIRSESSTISAKYQLLQLTKHIQAAIGSASKDITRGFHARLNGRFEEVKYKLHRMNQDFSFLEAVLAIVRI